MEIINSLLTVFQILLNLTKEEEAEIQNKNEAFTSMKFAYQETVKHIRKTRKNDSKDVTSTYLKDLWWEASHQVRPINRDIASIFEEKSVYWDNPDIYMTETSEGKRKYNFRFRLHEVKILINKLEKKWFKK